MKTAGWFWAQKLTFSIDIRLPLEMVRHNSLSVPNDMSDLTSKIQTWCTRYAKLANKRGSATESISNITTTDESEQKYRCEKHKGNNSHGTDRCYFLKYRNRDQGDAKTQSKDDKHCDVHGKC
ncbi:hypothetical protein SARC_02209 [Sphaeroforma arctica JP610]|uniref:Uncharacterized protein n=1 Tax=Sphaeroforma arctica JP610 TaxID=667725 RepID=A0A0L0G9T7_9EUKA|nr:hypothetical protein SARC_02209 [Sphaeroforma arctica JP610]KNC85636.1 hypothetical protein SARC_02209 [Sphaeroforma arctica JP610]|eukprot:XP_014159538.1 hypothetical protein SARC_02209 [Sphaeroforma arctica JP610]